MGNLLVAIYNAEIRRRRIKMQGKDGKKADCLASNTSNIMTKTTTVDKEHDETHKNDLKTWNLINNGSSSKFYVDCESQVRRASWHEVNERARKQWIIDQNFGKGSWNRTQTTYNIEKKRCSIVEEESFKQLFPIQECEQPTSACIEMGQSINKNWETLDALDDWNLVNKDATKHWNMQGRALLKTEVWNNIDPITSRHWNYEGYSLSKAEMKLWALQYCNT